MKLSFIRIAVVFLGGTCMGVPALAEPSAAWVAWMDGLAGVLTSLLADASSDPTLQAKERTLRALASPL